MAGTEQVSGTLVLGWFTDRNPSRSLKTMCPTKDEKLTFCQLLIPLIFRTNTPFSDLHTQPLLAHALAVRWSTEQQRHTRNTASLSECLRRSQYLDHHLRPAKYILPSTTIFMFLFGIRPDHDFKNKANCVCVRTIARRHEMRPVHFTWSGLQSYHVLPEVRPLVTTE